MIVFIGDGMGVTDQTAARWLLSEREGKPIQETKLAWEKWGISGMSKVSKIETLNHDNAINMMVIFNISMPLEG